MTNRKTPQTSKTHKTENISLPDEISSLFEQLLSPTSSIEPTLQKRILSKLVIISLSQDSKNLEDNKSKYETLFDFLSIDLIFFFSNNY